MAVIRTHRYAVDPADLEELLIRRAKLISTVQAVHSGLVETRLTRQTDGTFTDAWRWDSAEKMRAATAAASGMPEVGAAMSLVRNHTAEDGEILDERIAPEGGLS